jgi:hypothetical protein
MANQTQVRVDLRSISLSAAAQLAELPDGSFFIALDEPPPVRTVLSVREEGGEARAFEVSHVIEISEASPIGVTGCQGRFVEAKRLERQRDVGSEHHAPGEAQHSPEADGSDDGLAEETGSAPPEVQAAYDPGPTAEAVEAPQEEPPSAAPQEEPPAEPEAAIADASTSEPPPEEPPAETAPTEVAQDEPSAAEASDPSAGKPAVTSSGGKKRKGRKRK